MIKTRLCPKLSYEKISPGLTDRNAEREPRTLNRIKEHFMIPDLTEFDVVNPSQNLL
tara:strand:+ start:711 stop:881 length:171 start_codon:yes stop_codon:yes gene_type:complete